MRCVEGPKAYSDRFPPPDAPDARMDTTAPDLATPQEVLSFWFGACPPTDAAALAMQRQWFTKSDAFDASIRQRFGPSIEAALAGRLDGWAQEPLGWLALLVLLDQLTRNVFRGDARSFAGDAQAREIAWQGLARGWERELPWLARPFALLPLEHTEDLAVQDESVARFTALRADAQAQGAPEEVLQTLSGNLDYAERHRDVIRRFSRFPHRNAVLGRTSTAAEQHYLAQPGSGF